MFRQRRLFQPSSARLRRGLIYTAYRQGTKTLPPVHPWWGSLFTGNPPKPCVKSPLGLR